MTAWHARAVALRAQGHTFAEIALILGVTRGHVFNELTPAERIPQVQRCRQRAETQAWRAVARQMADQDGLSCAEIARRMGKHPNTVSSGLKRGSVRAPRATKPIRNVGSLLVAMDTAMPHVPARAVFGTGAAPGVSGDRAAVLEALCASSVPLSVATLGRRCVLDRARVRAVLDGLRDEGRARETNGGWTWGK